MKKEALQKLLFVCYSILVSVAFSEVGIRVIGSSDADGSIIEYYWSFGDGVTASGDDTVKTVKHTFEEAGRYDYAIVEVPGMKGTILVGPRQDE